MFNAYNDFKNEKYFSKVVKNDEILKIKNGNLSIQLYVESKNSKNVSSTIELDKTLKTIEKNQAKLNQDFESLIIDLKDLGIKD